MQRLPIVFLAGLVAYLVSAVHSERLSAADKPLPDIVFEYGTFQGHPVELVLAPAPNERGRRAILRVKFPPNDANVGIGNDKVLAYLKNEVMRLTATTRPRLLKKSGLYFEYGGGYPIWGPHTILETHASYECLFFAEHAGLFGGFLRAKGTPTIVGFYPYPPRATAKR